MKVATSNANNEKKPTIKTNNFKNTSCFHNYDMLASFMLQLIGREGPIILNSRVVEHNFFLEEDIGEEAYKKLGKDDEISIGNPNSPITVEDCLAALVRMNAHAAKIENERSYYFEGILEHDEKYFSILWGS